MFVWKGNDDAKVLNIGGYISEFWFSVNVMLYTFENENYMHNCQFYTRHAICLFLSDSVTDS